MFVMKSTKPLIQITSYYACLVLLGGMLLHFFPVLSQYSPIGGTENLSTGIGEFVSGKAKPIIIDSTNQMISLAISLFGLLLLMEPVAWVYMGARRRKGREQSFVLTVLLLPVVVAGIVIIVQNSLALAFSLAGIVAAVRFRLTLDDSLDAIFIFLSIGAGLAAGISALEIAAVVTIFFNYIMLFFWELDYADEVSVNRWFSKTWMHNTSVNKHPLDKQALERKANVDEPPDNKNSEQDSPR
ncbi:MAG: hypothetical protein ACJAVI_001519 [Candidatus Azotimanducaceae bacterium]|jgi:hypothetical protein